MEEINVLKGLLENSIFVGVLTGTVKQKEESSVRDHHLHYLGCMEGAQQEGFLKHGHEH